MPFGVVALLVLMLGVGSLWLDADNRSSADPAAGDEKGDERADS